MRSHDKIPQRKVERKKREKESIIPNQTELGKKECGCEMRGLTIGESWLLLLNIPTVHIFLQVNVLFDFAELARDQPVNIIVLRV